MTTAPRLLAALAAAVVLAACGGSATTDADRAGGGAGATEAPGSAPADGGEGRGGRRSAPRADERPYAVEVLDEVVTDTDRALLDPSGAELAPERVLATTIHVPVGEGPFPLVLFAHGYRGDPQRFSALLGTWAAAGYVVAAPTFPLTHDESPYTGADAWAGIADQPADLVVVAERVLALSAGDDHALSGRIDPDRIAVAGMSLGGGTAYGFAFGDCCRAVEPDAVVILGGATFATGDELELGSGLPTLVVHGDADATLPYAAAVDTYERLAEPRALVTLLGGSHSPPYEDWESPWDAVVEAVTVDFWDAYLAPGDGAADTGALDRLRTDGDVPEVATVVVAP